MSRTRSAAGSSSRRWPRPPRRRGRPSTALRGTVISGASPYDAKGLPTAVLGKTGVAVPRIGVGLGQPLCAVADEDEAQRILQAALDHGFYYWDTAYNYTNKSIVSEERLGRVLESAPQGGLPGHQVRGPGPRRGHAPARGQPEAPPDRPPRPLPGPPRRVHGRPRRARAPGRAPSRPCARSRNRRSPGSSASPGTSTPRPWPRPPAATTSTPCSSPSTTTQERRGDFESGAIPAAADRKMGVMIIKAVRPARDRSRAWIRPSSSATP
ncbi:MAG: aldo/keto reductase [Candidatus Moduliflexus flocculans]|nr:aldo/keto reductase [Candidatus Moduliflexus flocculans]